MQLLLPCAQLKKEENCWKMQSKLEAAKMAQACAQMSRCCFHNSLFVLTCILHNKTLSTFTKMCKYLSRNRKKLVEKVLEGHNWFYWYGHWARLELCISCSGPEMKSWIQDLVLIRTKWPDWFWQSPDFQMYWVPSWYFKVPILDVQGPHFGCSRSPLKLRTMLKYTLYQTSLISLPPNWSTDPSQGSCNRS